VGWGIMEIPSPSSRVTVAEKLVIAQEIVFPK